MIPICALPPCLNGVHGLSLRISCRKGRRRPEAALPVIGCPSLAGSDVILYDGVWAPAKIGALERVSVYFNSGATCT
jgi:hypothetical protein